MPPTTDLAVRQSVTVDVPPERAFAVFTADLASWWPLEAYHIGSQPAVAVVVEPRAGGRWYERAADGSECDWGRVLACDPPHRIVVSWQINANDETWFPDPDPAHASEIEVTFTGQPDGQTRVEFEHRHFERHGAGGDGIHAGVSSSGGWATILDSYAKVAATA